LLIVFYDFIASFSIFMFFLNILNSTSVYIKLITHNRYLKKIIPFLFKIKMKIIYILDNNLDKNKKQIFYVNNYLDNLITANIKHDSSIC